MAVSAIRAILPILLFLLNVPILALMQWEANQGSIFERFVDAVSVPVVVAVFIVLMALFFPDRIKTAASWLLKWWGKINAGPGEEIAAVEEKLLHEIDQFSRIFRLYVKDKPKRLLAASGWVLATFFADALIAIIVLWGFGIHPPVLKAVAVQFLIWPIIYLAPTPGSTGVFELTYLGFYSLYMPKPLIGLAILVFRLVITYLPMLAGVWFLAREFRRDTRLRKMVLEQRLSEAEI